MQGTVLVIAETLQGRLSKNSVEAIVAGQSLSADKLVLAIAGQNLQPVIDSAQTWAISEVCQLKHELLDAYSSDAYCLAFFQLIGKLKPNLILLPHSYQVRDYAPALAARCQRSLITDCIDVVEDTTGYLFRRQLFQGRVNVDVQAQGEAPYFASLQSGSFNADSIQKSTTSLQIKDFQPQISITDIRVKSEPAFRSTDNSVDLSKAEIIVAVGRGIKSADNIPMVQQFAKLLGAELAASRPVCDEGWLPGERQVGSSGQTVSPKIYIALGISGAIQHLVGMKSASTVVAINTDVNAPIFKIADYGIVGDIFQIIPELIKVLEQKR